MRATVALRFLVGEVISLVGLARSGRFFGAGFTTSLWLLPAVVIGVWLCSLVHRCVGGRDLRYGILFFAIVSGIAVIVQTL